MKLFLAVAVLLLAFAAHTGAQEAEPKPELTVEQRLADFGAQVTEFSSNLADKTKEAFKKIHIKIMETIGHWIGEQINNWLDEEINKVKTSRAATTN